MNLRMRAWNGTAARQIAYTRRLVLDYYLLGSRRKYGGGRTATAAVVIICSVQYIERTKKDAVLEMFIENPSV